MQSRWPAQTQTQTDVSYVHPPLLQLTSAGRSKVSGALWNQQERTLVDQEGCKNGPWRAQCCRIQQKSFYQSGLLWPQHLSMDSVLDPTDNTQSANLKVDQTSPPRRMRFQQQLWFMSSSGTIRTFLLRLGHSPAAPQVHLSRTHLKSRLSGPPASFWSAFSSTLPGMWSEHSDPSCGPGGTFSADRNQLEDTSKDFCCFFTWKVQNGLSTKSRSTSP